MRGAFTAWGPRAVPGAVRGSHTSFPGPASRRFLACPTRARERPGYPQRVDPRAPTLEDLSSPACLLIDPDGRIGWHNEAFGDWAGRPAACGVTLDALFPGDFVIAGLWGEASTGVAVEHHVDRRGPDGVASFWSVRARRAGGGVLVVATDLTAFAQAAHAVHAVQRTFAAAAAHELRAPLSAIKAWASAVGARRRAPREDGDRLLDDGLTAIARQVDRMNTLLSDLLDAARSSAGALRAARVAVPVADLIDRAVDAAPAGGRVTLDPLPDVPVLVDPRHVEAAFARLVAALAARRPEDSIAVTAAVEGAEVRISLGDGGPPLSGDADPFGRAPRPGRSLGLHVAQLFVAASGGRVWRERDAFVLALPVARPPPRRAPGPLRVLAVLGAGARAASVLRLYGHHVASAEALAPDDAGAFDLILADPRLPGVDVAAIAAVHARPDPPEIIVLAPARSPAITGAERAGALAVLPDPIDWAHLLALVQASAALRGAG